jgi:hypothetical protein
MQRSTASRPTPGNRHRVGLDPLADRRLMQVDGGYPAGTPSGSADCA